MSGGGGGLESEFGTFDFKYSRHNVTGSTEKPVQQELHTVGKLESWMFHTIILLTSNLNKKEGYLLGLSVLYIFKKEIFFSSQKFG